MYVPYIRMAQEEKSNCEWSFMKLKLDIHSQCNGEYWDPHEMLVITFTRISIGNSFTPHSTALMNYSVNPVRGDKCCML